MDHTLRPKGPLSHSKTSAKKPTTYDIPPSSNKDTVAFFDSIAKKKKKRRDQAKGTSCLALTLFSTYVI